MIVILLNIPKKHVSMMSKGYDGMELHESIRFRIEDVDVTTPICATTNGACFQRSSAALNQQNREAVTQKDQKTSQRKK